ncbi:pecanex-like protein 4 [Amblyomma americanum]
MLQSNLAVPQVDEMFESLLGAERCLLNPVPWHVLLPLDLAPVTAYTSSAMSLTGVLDSAGFLESLPPLFHRCLLWTLLGQRLEDVGEDSAEVVPTAAATAGAGDTWEDPVFRATSFDSVAWSDSDDPLEDGAGKHQPEMVLPATSRQATSQLPWATRRGLHFPSELPAVQPSAALMLSPPPEWLDFIREKVAPSDSVLSPLLGETEEDWWSSVLRRYARRMPPQARSECEDPASGRRLLLQYSGLSALCRGLVLPTGRLPQPSDVAAGFAGEALRSGASSAQQGRLVDGVVRAFRYSTKLCMDKVMVGPASGDEELLDELVELRNNWHLDGARQSPAWHEALRAHTPHLLHLAYDPVQEAYRSERLTLGTQLLALGSLRAQVVQAVWASLSLELLYLANDDDERYSIQADPVLLRNLIVQAADPPLGYCVYSSGPIVVDTF